MIYVRDLLKLDTFKDFELVSGENGLDRGVSWPNVAQTVSIREWLVGGDVILMSGVGLKITDEFLTDIVIQAADGRAACIIMLINPEHIASIPQAAIDEAVKRGLAVFAAPWETKLSRVIGSVSMLVSNDRLEERMHSEFLDRLLSGEINHDDSAYRQSMEKYGLLGKKAVAVIDYKFDEKYLQTENQAYHNDRVMRKMISLFERYFGKINYLNQYNRQAFIISADNTEEKDIVNAIRTIYNIFIKENKHVHVRIGIGEIAQGLEGLKKRFPTVEAMAAADIGEVEELIRSCGFYHGKARDLVWQAQRITEVYGGKVPDNMDDLLTLPGVGRKSANLILGDVFRQPGAVVVDTHCIRLSNRLGLVDNDKDPVRIEKALRAVLPPEKSNDFCHRLVLHGRAVCTARKPLCDICCCAAYCKTLNQ